MSKVWKFSCRVLDFSIHIVLIISHQNKLVCAQKASKKITRFVPLLVHLLEIRWLGSWNTSPRRRSGIFFLLVVFFPTTFVYSICSENAVHIGGFYFMRLATYKIRVPDSLCSPLIRCRMQGKRTDYCKVRIEVLNLFPGENSGQNSWKPWANVMTPHFCDGQHGDKQQYRSQI